LIPARTRARAPAGASREARARERPRARAARAHQQFAAIEAIQAIPAMGEIRDGFNFFN